MAPARFGELVHLGEGRLQEAVLRPDPCPHGQQAVIRQLLRLAAVLTGHLHDVAPFDPATAMTRADLTWWQAAAIDMSTALGSATAALTAAAGPESPAEDSLLAGAATALAAGRDLLHTHHPPGPDGNSLWSQVVASPAAERALADQVARWSLLAALLAERAAAAGPEPPAGPGGALAAAARWLRVASAAAAPARHADPPAASDLVVLYAVPAAAPERVPPRRGEPDDELCQGIIASAARLQAAAITAAGRPAWSPTATAGAWRWDAAAGAVASHLSELVLRAAAARAAELGLPGADEAAAAADAMAAAVPRWHFLGIKLGQVTTEIRFLASPEVTEASDLLVRLGRLSHASPAWTPAIRDRGPLRSPAAMAPDPDAVTGLLAAVHHAACALEVTAIADRAAVRAAFGAGRLHVPTRSMPERLDIPRPYAPAPAGRAEDIDGVYATCAAAAGQAVQALDRAAAAAGAPSEFLAAARAAASARAAVRPSLGMPAGRVRPGAAERDLRVRGITDLDLLLRAVAIDASAQVLNAEAGHSRPPRPPRPARPGPDPPRLGRLPARPAGRSCRGPRTGLNPGKPPVWLCHINCQVKDDVPGAGGPRQPPRGAARPASAVARPGDVMRYAL